MATAKKTAGPKAPYRVLSPISHDGELYGEAEMIELSEVDAAPLIASGVVATVIVVEKSA